MDSILIINIDSNQNPSWPSIPKEIMCVTIMAVELKFLEKSIAFSPMAAILLSLMAFLPRWLFMSTELLALSNAEQELTIMKDETQQPLANFDLLCEG
ncbi:hypothetical protein ASPCAL07442 [Aspergillus calidoustus]|uniref:Uncharacterized protein n=1 Tax=Aspergillus calidoustus TaxID=454130 RepID=A0A0U5G3Q7_ASPCI|nr:hypothetical protein ASPCAL07442 [Aspergillus calidoustus]